MATVVVCPVWETGEERRSPLNQPLQLTLISHASTDALRRARFPVDEPLNAAGERELARAGTLPAGMVLAAPEHRAISTAAGLGAVTPVTDTGLRDLDAGSWRGLTMDDIAEPDLISWLSDPAAKPHGGESITELIARVGDWLASQAGESGTTVAVTHPAVVRAAVISALEAPPASFWRIDVPPLSRTRLHYRGGEWTLRLG